MSDLMAKVAERLEWLEGLMRDDPSMGQWHLHLDYDPSGTCRCSIEVLNKSGKRSVYSSEPLLSSEQMTKPYTEEDVQAALADIRAFAAVRDLPEEERAAQLKHMARLERRKRHEYEALRLLMTIQQRGMSSQVVDMLTNALLEAEERGRKATGG